MVFATFFVINPSFSLIMLIFAKLKPTEASRQIKRTFFENTENAENTEDSPAKTIIIKHSGYSVLSVL